MKMEDYRNYDSFLPVFIDNSGEAYYQQGQVEKKLVIRGLRKRFPNLFRRHATPEEIPVLKSLGMRPSNQIEGERVVLVKVKEIHDMLEQNTIKYLAVPKKRSSAGSETISPTLKESKKLPFTSIQLVSQAIISSENSGLSSREIVDWISNAYPHYQSTTFRLKSRVSEVLSKSNFFTNNKRSREWYIVQKHESRLWKYAYMPHAGWKIGATSDGRSKSLSKPKVLDRINVVEDDVTALSASTSQKIKPEVSDIEGLIENDVPDAVNASAPQEIKPEVLDTIDLVEENVTAINTSPLQNIKPEVLDIIDLVEDDVTIVGVSAPQKIKPEVLDTIDLVGNDLLTAVNAPPSEEIMKLEVLDIIDLVEDDENAEFECQAVNISHQLECIRTNPIKFPIINNYSIDPAAGKIDIQCPICEAQFSTNEALGEHVGAHRRVASTDANEIAKEALQNLTASLCGRNPESPIFVFSGNVYLTAKNPVTP